MLTQEQVQQFHRDGSHPVSARPPCSYMKLHAAGGLGLFAGGRP